VESVDCACHACLTLARRVALIADTHGHLSAIEEEPATLACAQLRQIVCAGGAVRLGLQLLALINLGSAGPSFARRRNGSSCNLSWIEYTWIDFRSPADIVGTRCRTAVPVEQSIQAILADGMPMAGRRLADWSSP